MAITPINLIWLCCVCAVLGTFIGSLRAGGIAYLAAILLAPVGEFFGATVRVESALAPLMLAWLAFSGAFRWRAALVPFAFWIVWLITVSVCTEGNVQIIGLYGNARFVAVALIFASIPWREEDFLRAQYGFAVSAIPIGLLSVGQVLNLPGARGLTKAAFHYTSQAVFDGQIAAEAQGHVFRGLGVFGNVSPAATYFLLAAGVAAILLCDRPRTNVPVRRWALTCSLLAAIAGGLSTFSATFIGGLGPAMVGAMLVVPPRGLFRGVAIVGSLLCLGLGIACLLIATSDGFGAQLAYQWNRIANSTVLDSRYSAESGVLAEAIEAIQERPFAGIGVKETGAFGADSMYVSLLLKTGAGGAVFFFVGLGGLALLMLDSGMIGRLAFFWLFIVLLAGIGSTGMFILRFGDYWWATQGMMVAIVELSRQRCKRETSALGDPFPARGGFGWQRTGEMLAPQ